MDESNRGLEVMFDVSIDLCPGTWYLSPGFVFHHFQYEKIERAAQIPLVRITDGLVTELSITRDPAGGPGTLAQAMGITHPSIRKHTLEIAG